MGCASSQHDVQPSQSDQAIKGNVKQSREASSTKNVQSIVHDYNAHNDERSTLSGIEARMMIVDQPSIQLGNRTQSNDDQHVQEVQPTQNIQPSFIPCSIPKQDSRSNGLSTMASKSPAPPSPQGSITQVREVQSAMLSSIVEENAAQNKDVPPSRNARSAMQTAMSQVSVNEESLSLGNSLSPRDSFSPRKVNFPLPLVAAEDSRANGISAEVSRSSIRADMSKSSRVSRAPSIRAEMSKSSTKYGERPLYKASEYGDEEAVEELLTHGYEDVDEKDHQERTSLMLASEGKHEGIVEALVKAGANVNAADRVRFFNYSINLMSLMISSIL